MKKRLLVLLVAAMAVVVNLEAQVIVLSESFEKGIPARWTQECVQGNQTWVTEVVVPGGSLLYPDGAASGLGRALLRNTTGESKGYKTRLITPVMNLDTVFQPILRYYHAQMKWTADFDTLRVLYRVSESSNWVLLQEFTQPIQMWTKETVELPRVGKTYQVCFEGSENMGRGIVLDSVVVRSKPECTIPHDMTVTNMHKNEVTLNWLASFDAVNFHIIVAKTDEIFDIDDTDIESAKANGLIVKDTVVSGWQTYVQLTNLEGKTNYVAFVRSLCENENSDWGAYPFYMKAIENLPYHENFDISQSSVVGQHKDWTFGTDLAITTPYINCNQSATAAKYFVRSGYALCFAGKTSPGSGANIAAKNYAYAATPMMDVEDISTCQVRFWGSLGNYGSYKTNARAIIVGVMDDPDDITTFVAVDTVKMWRYATYENVLVSLASYTGEGRYVAFVSQFDEPNQFYIDDLTIEERPAVPNVSGIQVAPLATGAELTWDNVASAYNVLISTENADDASTIAAAKRVVEAKVSTSAYKATGLTEGTQYYAYVQAEGGEWSAAKPFATSYKKTLPMKFGFETAEGTTTIGTSSTKYPKYVGVYSTASNYPTFQTTKRYVNSGSQALNYSLELGRDAWIAFPVQDSVVQGLEMEFYMRVYSSSYKNTEVTVGVMTDPADLTTFVAVASFATASESYALCYTDFLSYTGNGKYIAIRWTENEAGGATSSSYMRSYPVLDDVTIDVLSDCVVPKLGVKDVTSSTATLEWTARNMHSFHILVDTDGGKKENDLTAALASPASVVYTDTLNDVNEFTIPTGKLHWGRTYYAYIRSACGENENSYWSRPIEFTLGTPEAVALPYLEDFDYYGAGVGAMAAGWNMASVDNYPQLSTSAKYSSIGSKTNYAGVHFKSAGPGRAGRLFAPALDIDDYANVKVSFWAKKGDNIAGSDTLRIGVANQTDTNAVITWLDTIAIPQTSRFDKYYSVNPQWSASMGKYFVFQQYCYNGVTTRYVYVDDITFESLTNITPFGFKTEDAGNNSVTISWQGESENGWKIWVTTDEIDTDNLDKVDASKIVIRDSTITNNPFTINGLKPQTGYYVYLKAIDGEEWSEVYNAWTQCIKLVPNSSASRQGFEGYLTASTTAITSYDKSTFPECWTRHGGDEYKPKPSYVPFIHVGKTTTAVPSKDSYSYSGYAGASLYAQASAGGPSWFTTPEIDAKDMKNVTVSFWARGGDSKTLAMYVGVMTDPDDWSTFKSLHEYQAPDRNTWCQVECNLGACGYKEGMGNHIVFSTSAALTYTTSYYIDDIEISESACPKAYPTISRLTDNSARLMYSSANIDVRMLLSKEMPIEADSLNSDTEGAAYLTKILANSAMLKDTTILSNRVFALKDLESTTQYYVAVQTLCEEDQSLWNVTSFQTLCAPQTAAEMGTITFEEGFDLETSGASSDPHVMPCWTVGKKGIKDYLYIPYVGKGKAAPAGEAFLRFRTKSDAASNGAYAIMPAVNVDSIKRLQISFLGRASKTHTFSAIDNIEPLGNYAGSIIVGVVTDPADIGTFSAIDTITYTDNAVHKSIVRFNKYEGFQHEYGKHVAFLSEFNQDNYFFIDNIKFDTITGCGTPISLKLSNITNNSALASWKGINDTYRVMVTTSELQDKFLETNRDYVINDTINGTTHTLTGLNGNITYYLYVKSLCDGGEGEWCLEGAVFTTECPEVAILPYKDNFDRYQSGSKYYPACWRRFYNGNEDEAASYPCIYSSAKYGDEGNGLQWKISSSSYGAEDKRPTIATLPIGGDIDKVMLSFKLRTASAVASPNGIMIGYATDVTNIDSLLKTVQYVDTVYPLANSKEWTEIIRTMEDCSGENVCIVLSEFYKNTTDVYMDNFKVEKTPTCYVPKAEVDSIGAEEVKLTIHPYFATDHAWDAMIISADYADTVQASSADTTFIVKGLKHSTEYNLFVRTECGDGDVSEWSDEAVPFRTLYCIGAGTYYSFEEEDGEEERVTYSYYSPSTPNYGDCYVHPSLYVSGRVSKYWPTHANGTAYAHNGKQALRFWHYNDGSAPTLVALPEIVGSDSLQIRFDMRAAEVAASVSAKIDRTKTWPFAELGIGLIDANHDLESFQPLATYKTTDYENGEKVTAAKNALFDQVVFPLPTGIKDKFIAFVMKQPISLKLYIDNLYIEKKQGYRTPVIGKTTITPTSLTLNWDANESTKWNVYLTKSAEVFPIDSAKEADIVAKQTVTANTVTFSGLTPDTKYFAFVQVADVDGLGATSARRTFVTPADVKVATSDTISFEDSKTTRMVVPQNWYVGNDGSVAALQQPGALLNNYDATSTSKASGAVAARTGTRALQLYSTYGTHLGAYVAMPILKADYDTIQVNFYARPFYQKKDGKVGSSYDNRPLVVGTMTDPNNIATFEPIDSFYYANAAVSTSDLVKNLTDDGWEKFGIRLKGRAGQYLAFSAPVAGQWYIDDITFSERTCLKPTKLRATNLTGHSATLSWSAADEDVPCILQVSSTTEFGTTDLVFIDTLTTQKATIADLEGTTTYYYRVRQDCDLVNEWSMAQSFTTECAEIMGGYTNSFEDEEKHVLLPKAYSDYQPQCWVVGTTYGKAVGKEDGSPYYHVPRLVKSSGSTWYSHNTLSSSLKDIWALRFYGQGAKELTSSNYMNYYDQWIAMPVLENVDLDTLQLSFYALPGSYNPQTGAIAKGAKLNTIVIGVMSDPNDLSTFAALDTCTYSRDLTGAVATAANEYMAQRFEVPLAGMKDKGNYIAFRTDAQGWIEAHPEYEQFSVTTTLYIDDIVLEHVNNCPMPTNLKANNIALTSATLSWDGDEDAQFVVNVSSDATFNNTDAFIIQNEVVNTNSIVVTGLDTATTYYWSVATQCTPTMVSMAAAEQFNTLRVPMFDEMFIEDVVLPADWIKDGTRAKDVFAGETMNDRITSGSYTSGWARTFPAEVVGVEGPHMQAPLNSSYGETGQQVTKKSWLMTPGIVLNDTQDAWLTFNVALTYFNQADAAEQTGWDDQFMVVISDDGGDTWKRENAIIWNNETSNDETDAHYVYGKGDYVLNSLPNKAVKDEPVTIDLTQYKGKTIKVGFYVESTIKNAYNGIHIGNVHINYFAKKSDAQTACQFEDIESMGLFYVDGDKVVEGENVFTKVAIATAETNRDVIDTLYTLTATYNMAPQVVINQTICEGETVGNEWGFADRTSTGVYKRKTTSLVTGCDSITTLNLTVIPRQYTTLEENICSGTSYEFNGKQYNKTGVYVDTLSSLVTGCDSITKLVLTVNPPITAQVNAYTCIGHPYYFTPRYPSLTLSGTYMDTVKTAEGCDSIVTLTLTVAESININVYDTVCDGQSLRFEGQDYTEAGTYPVHLESVFGCDSIRTLYLEIAPVYSDTINASICPGRSYTEHGFDVSEPGLYSVTETSRFGCDSVIWLNLSLYDTDTIRVDTLIQLSDLPYFYPNTQITYPLSTEPGTYVDTIFVKGKDAQCDYILIHRLTVDGGQGLRNVIFGSVSLRPSLINAGESVTATGDFLGQAIDIQVYDMVGHCIKREQKSGRDIHIDGFHVAGIYTIQITDENGKQYMGRVIVK